MTRLVVISPHLDDAVFSCGTLIAAASVIEPALVVTVCAGVPTHFDHATTLDAAAGFTSSAHAVETRRTEDHEACAALGAEALHLDVLDAQYMDPDSDDQRVSVMRGALLAAFEYIERESFPSSWCIVSPVGIRHRDHINVSLACDNLPQDLLYDELPYRVLWPEQTPAHLGGIALQLQVCPAKMAAVTCYRSQIGNGPPGPELSEAEIYRRP